MMQVIDKEEYIAAKEFTDDDILSVELYGEGHINGTYLVMTRGKNGKESKFVLQKINEKIFSDVDGLMSNICFVTQFMRDKTIQRGGNPDEECLTVIKTRDGAPYFRHGDVAWRAYKFLDGKTYQAVESTEQLKASAKAFGEFARDLNGFDVSLLFDVLPDFHNTQKRYERFIESVERDVMRRADSVREEINFVTARQGYCGRIVSLLESGEMPKKVTHNDTKLNNLIFDKAGKRGLAVIDLDTVMSGSICYDFGDSIRFACNHCAEDERDLKKVNFDSELFRAYSEGYMSAVGDVITNVERENLAFSAILMTYECGMRFLTDYLDGDVYFRIHRSGHNLDRARTQFKLVADMERDEAKMRRIIEDCCG